MEKETVAFSVTISFADKVIGNFLHWTERDSMLEQEECLPLYYPLKILNIDIGYTRNALNK